MKLVSTLLIIFLAVQTGTGRNAPGKSGAWDSWDDLVNIFKDLADKLSNVENDILNDVKNGVGDIVDKAKKLIDGVVGNFQGLVEEDMASIEGLADDVMARINESKDKLGPMFTDLSKTFDSSKTQITDIITEVENTVQSSAAQISKKVEETVAAGSLTITGQIQKVVDTINQAIEEKWTNVETCSKQFMPDLKTYSAQSLNALKGCAADATGKLQDAITPALELVPKAKSLFEEFTSNLSASVNGGDFTKIPGILAEEAKDVASLVTETASSNLKIEANIVALAAGTGNCATNVAKDTIAGSLDFGNRFKECTK